MPQTLPLDKKAKTYNEVPHGLPFDNLSVTL
jgi:hypothetical protein